MIQKEPPEDLFEDEIDEELPLLDHLQI